MNYTIIFQVFSIYFVDYQQNIYTMNIKKIWETASQKQRNELMTLIVMDGVSYPTAYSWCNGTRRPKPLYQENIRKYVNDVFGVEESVEELFPEKR